MFGVDGQRFEWASKPSLAPQFTWLFAINFRTETRPSHTSHWFKHAGFDTFLSPRIQQSIPSNIAIMLGRGKCWSPPPKKKDQKSTSSTRRNTISFEASWFWHQLTGQRVEQRVITSTCTCVQSMGTRILSQQLLPRPSLNVSSYSNCGHHECPSATSIGCFHPQNTPKGSCKSLRRFQISRWRSQMSICSRSWSWNCRTTHLLRRKVHITISIYARGSSHLMSWKHFLATWPKRTASLKKSWDGTMSLPNNEAALAPIYWRYAMLGYAKARNDLLIHSTKKCIRGEAVHSLNLCVLSRC